MRLFLYIICAFIWIACTPVDKHDDLNRVEELLSQHPDSAFWALQKIQTHYTGLSNPDKAYFGLLYFQALDKNYQDLEPLEWIEFSIHYYHKEKNYPRLSQSLLYKSRVYKYAYNFQDAVPLLLDAERFADKNQHDLMGKIYADLAHCSYYVDENADALQYAQEALHEFEAIHDTHNIVQTLLIIASIYSADEDYDSAFQYSKKALSHSLESDVSGDVCYFVAYNYYDLEKYDSAAHYVRLSLEYDAKEIPYARRLLLLSDIHLKQEEYDKALNYAQIAFEYEMDYYEKRNYYRIMTAIYFALNDKFKAAGSMEMHQIYQDSITQIETQTTVNILKEQHQATQFIKKIQSQTRILLLIIVIFAVLVFFVIQYLYKRYKHHQISNYQHEQTLLLRQEKLRQDIKRQIENQKKQDIEKRLQMTEQERNAYDVKIYKQVLGYDQEHEFIEKLNRLFSNMPQVLQKRYPTIQYEDILRCSLLLLDIPMSDIALIFNVKYDTIRKQNLRLAKKLQFANINDFKKFLQQFL